MSTVDGVLVSAHPWVIVVHFFPQENTIVVKYNNVYNRDGEGLHKFDDPGEQ